MSEAKDPPMVWAVIGASGRVWRAETSERDAQLSAVSFANSTGEATRYLAYDLRDTELQAHLLKGAELLWAIGEGLDSYEKKLELDEWLSAERKRRDGGK